MQAGALARSPPPQPSSSAPGRTAARPARQRPRSRPSLRYKRRLYSSFSRSSAKRSLGPRSSFPPSIRTGPATGTSHRRPGWSHQRPPRGSSRCTHRPTERPSAGGTRPPFRQLPLTDEEFRTNAANVAPYMR